MTSSLTEANELLEQKQLQIEELTKKLQSAQRNITMLQHQVEQLLRRVYGRRSEKLDPNQLMQLYTGRGRSLELDGQHEAALVNYEEMAELGVEPYDVAQHVFGTYSLGRIKLLNLALDSIEISDNGKLSMMTVTKSMLAETDTQPEDVDGMINYARRIKNVKVAALIQEIQNGSEESVHINRYHVSLRSDGTVDVATIASSFGGGGHVNAAGFQIESSLLNLKTEIITLAEKL